MQFVLLAFVLMAIVVLIVYKAAQYFGFELKLQALVLCAVMALIVNFGSIVLATYLSFEHVFIIIGLVVASAGLVTYYNEKLIDKDKRHPELEEEDEENVGAEFEEEPVGAPTSSTAYAGPPSPEGNTSSTACGGPPSPEGKVGEVAAEPIVESESEKDDVGAQFIEPADEPEAADESEAEAGPEEEIVSKPEVDAEPIVNVEPEENPVGAQFIEPAAELEVNVEPEPVAEPEEEIVAKPEVAAEPEVISVLEGEELEPIVEAEPEVEDEAEEVPTSSTACGGPPSPEGKVGEPAAEPIVETEPSSMPSAEPPVLPDGLNSLDDYLDYAYEARSKGNNDAALLAYKEALTRFNEDSYAPFVAIEFANLLKTCGTDEQVRSVYELALTLPAVQNDEGLQQEFRKSIDTLASQG